MSAAVRLAPVLVGARVDWLEVAFRVDLSDKSRKLLQRRAVVARREETGAGIVLALRPFKMAPPRIEGLWRLQNEVCRVEVNEKAPGGDEHTPGWTVRCTFSGTSLLATGWRTAIEEAWHIAKGVGVVVEARFGRLDLCADVAHYGLSPDDRLSFVKQRRVSSRSMFHDGKPKVRRKKRTGTSGEVQQTESVSWVVDGRKIFDEEQATHVMMWASGDTFTGFTIGNRETVSCRIYDKLVQLRTQATDSRLAEFGWWQGQGWDGKAPVTRVEFQVSGEALVELSMRLPVRGEAGAAVHVGLFGACLDGLWAYCSQKWLRLVRRGERTLLPKWREVQRAVFVAASEPRERHRRRGAASAAQAEGALLSLVASTGNMPAAQWPPRIDPKTGEVDDARPNDDERDMVAEFVAGAGEVEAQRAAGAQVEREVAALLESAAPLLVQYRFDRSRGDKLAALARTWTRHRAALARFAVAELDPPTEMARSA